MHRIRLSSLSHYRRPSFCISPKMDSMDSLIFYLTGIAPRPPLMPCLSAPCASQDVYTYICRSTARPTPTLLHLRLLSRRLPSLLPLPLRHTTAARRRPLLQNLPTLRIMESIPFPAHHDFIIYIHPAISCIDAPCTLLAYRPPRRCSDYLSQSGLADLARLDSNSTYPTYLTAHVCTTIGELRAPHC